MKSSVEVVKEGELSLEETSEIHQALSRSVSPVHDLVLVPAVKTEARKLDFLVLKLQHLLLEAIPHDVPDGADRSPLAETVHSIDGLSFGSWVVLWFHDIDVAGTREIETQPASHDGYQDDADRGVLAESIHSCRPRRPAHLAIQPRIGDADVVQSNLDEVEMRGPPREDYRLDGWLVGILGTL